MLTDHLTKEEKVKYHSLVHDIEQARVTLGSLELQKEKLLKMAFDRTGNNIYKNSQDHPNV